MLEQGNSLTLFSEHIHIKKEKYSEYLKKMETMLAALYKEERKILDKIADVEQRYSGQAGIKGFHTDIEKTHQVGKYESQLSHINALQKDLTRNISMIKSKYENLSLRIDKICFDNIVMIDAIVKNFVTMSEL